MIGFRGIGASCKQGKEKSENPHQSLIHGSQLSFIVRIGGLMFHFNPAVLSNRSAGAETRG